MLLVQQATLCNVNILYCIFTFRNYFVVGVTSFNLGCNSVLNDNGNKVLSMKNIKIIKYKIKTRSCPVFSLTSEGSLSRPG